MLKPNRHHSRQTLNHSNKKFRCGVVDIAVIYQDHSILKIIQIKHLKSCFFSKNHVLYNQDNKVEFKQVTETTPRRRALNKCLNLEF